MAHGKIYRIIQAFVEEKNGSKILTHSFEDNYVDCELDLSKKGHGEIQCLFNPYPGDNVKLYLTKDSSVVFRIGM